MIIIITSKKLLIDILSFSRPLTKDKHLLSIRSRRAITLSICYINIFKLLKNTIIELLLYHDSLLLSFSSSLHILISLKLSITKVLKRLFSQLFKFSIKDNLYIIYNIGLDSSKVCKIHSSFQTVRYFITFIIYSFSITPNTRSMNLSNTLL